MEERIRVRFLSFAALRVGMTVGGLTRRAKSPNSSRKASLCASPRFSPVSEYDLLSCIQSPQLEAECLDLVRAQVKLEGVPHSLEFPATFLKEVNFTR